jgi:hypothetical protein
MDALEELKRTPTALFPKLFKAIEVNLKERHKRSPGDPFYSYRISRVTICFAQALLLDQPYLIVDKYRPAFEQCKEDCGVGLFVVLIKKTFKPDRIDHILYSYTESIRMTGDDD